MTARLLKTADSLEAAIMHHAAESHVPLCIDEAPGRFNVVRWNPASVRVAGAREVSA